MKSRVILISLSLIVTAGAATGAIILRSAPDGSQPGVTATASPATSSTPGPLSIAATRAHALTPGAITTERQLPSRGGCATRVVSYGSDGLKQYALETVPATPRPAAGYPVIVFAHGYIDPASYRTDGTDYQAFINRFCAAGYLVLKPDYRGNGDSAGSATSGHFMPDYTYDVLNLAASIGSLPEADPGRVALAGHSLGGAVVLRAAVADHGLPIKAYVLVSGVVGSLTDLVNGWPAAQVPVDLKPVRQAFIDQYGAPSNDVPFWHDASSINYVDAIRAPVQIHHGDADEVVPPAFSRNLDAALSTAGRAHEYFTYPGGDHQYSGAAARQLFLDRTVAFLDTNLK